MPLGDALPGLRRLEVVVVPAVSRWSNRIWACDLTADEDIVGLLLLVQEGRLLWAKTPVAARTLRAEVSWGAYPEPGEIQLSGTLAGAFTYSLGAVTDGPPQAEADAARLTTGASGRLARVLVHPLTEVWALLLVRTEIRFGRNHLWRLRPDLVAQLSEPFAKMLNGGKCGSANIGGGS